MGKIRSWLIKILGGYSEQINFESRFPPMNMTYEHELVKTLAASTQVQLLDPLIGRPDEEEIVRRELTVGLADVLMTSDCVIFRMTDDLDQFKRLYQVELKIVLPENNNERSNNNVHQEKL